MEDGASTQAADIASPILTEPLGILVTKKIC